MKQGVRGSKAKDAAMIGKAGELVVAAQLIIRGMPVGPPYIDRGYDLMADNGCKIQVKTARIRTSPSVLKVYGCPVYSFHFPKSRQVAISANEVKTIGRAKFADRCDIVVMWGVEENRFWIVPAWLADERQCLFLGPATERKFAKDIAEMQEMVKLGFTQTEIGEYYGIGQASVGRRLQKAGTISKETRTATIIRQCENAWHYILDFDPANRVSQEVGDRNLRLVDPVAVNET